jgi:hypothetical protein
MSGGFRNALAALTFESDAGRSETPGASWRVLDPSRPAGTTPASVINRPRSATPAPALKVRGRVACRRPDQTLIDRDRRARVDGWGAWTRAGQVSTASHSIAPARRCRPRGGAFCAAALAARSETGRNAPGNPAYALALVAPGRRLTRGERGPGRANTVPMFAFLRPSEASYFSGLISELGPELVSQGPK